jgi:DNA-binding XRE family transcriptional regulator
MGLALVLRCWQLEKAIAHLFSSRSGSYFARSLPASCSYTSWTSSSAIRRSALPVRGIGLPSISLIGTLQRLKAGEHMGVSAETVANWEKDNTKPVPSKCKPVIAFLGYDPSPEPKTLAERVEAKRRVLGLTFEQVADYLGWDPSTLTHYLNGTWRLSQKRAEALDRFLSLDGEAGAAASAIPRRRR